jgi:hypothetical protein
MYLPFGSAVVAESEFGPITLPEPCPRRTAREEHAHLLEVAAARRLRAAERLSMQRHDDAEYWKAIAPSALRRAAGLREHPSFAALPD